MTIWFMKPALDAVDLRVVDTPTSELITLVVFITRVVIAAVQPRLESGLAETLLKNSLLVVTFLNVTRTSVNSLS